MLVYLALLLAFDVIQGIPESAEAPPTSGSVPSGQAVNVSSQPQAAQAAQPAAVPSTGPNANPLDLFPQVRVYFRVWFYIDLSKIIRVIESWLYNSGVPNYGLKCWWCEYLRFSTKQSPGTVV